MLLLSIRFDEFAIFVLILRLVFHGIPLFVSTRSTTLLPTNPFFVAGFETIRTAHDTTKSSNINSNNTCSESIELLPMQFEHGEVLIRTNTESTTATTTTTLPTLMKECLVGNHDSTTDSSSSSSSNGVWYSIRSSSNTELLIASLCAYNSMNNEQQQQELFMSVFQVSDTNNDTRSTHTNGNNCDRLICIVNDADDTINNNDILINNNNQQQYSSRICGIFHGNNNDSSSDKSTTTIATSIHHSSVSWRSKSNAIYYIFIHHRTSSTSNSTSNTPNLLETRSDDILSDRHMKRQRIQKFSLIIIEEDMISRFSHYNNYYSYNDEDDEEPFNDDLNMDTTTTSPTNNNSQPQQQQLALPPRNDNCNQAIELSLNQLGYGSTTAASSNHQMIYSCGTASRSTLPGVWYKIRGTGEIYKVSTCEYTTFDTQISIFTAAIDTSSTTTAATTIAQITTNSTSLPSSWLSMSPLLSSCGGNNNPNMYLICVDGTNNNACGMTGKQSTITWQTQVNKTYYILLHGNNNKNNNVSNETAGQYSIVISAVKPKPINDDCTDALLLTSFSNNSNINTIVRGNTDSATNEDYHIIEKMNLCGSANKGSAPGIWYYVVGTGHTLQVSTCTYSNYNTQISVFEGQCSIGDDISSSSSLPLLCVGSNYDEDNEHCTTVKWNSTVDVIYPILVHGSYGQTGSFDIQLLDGRDSTIMDPWTVTTTTTSRTNHDQCANAIPIPSTGILMNASTLLLSNRIATDISACGDATQPIVPGVWFVMNGTGTLLRAHTCMTGSNGGSDSLYSPFDTQISVFTALSSLDSCDEKDLVCVDGNDDWCDILSAVKWQSQLNKAYYILVHGFDNDDAAVFTATTSHITDNVRGRGDFSLIVDRLEPSFPENSLSCDYAIPLSLGVEEIGVTTYAIPTTNFNSHLNPINGCDMKSSTTSGSRIASNSDNNNNNNLLTLEQGQQKGLWYSIQGTGNKMVAQTCNRSSSNNGGSGSSDQIATTDFDTQITVFNGYCNRHHHHIDVSNLTCLIRNDDSCGIQSKVEWDTVADEIYYVFVHGYTISEFGQFHLFIDEVTTITQQQQQQQQQQEQLTITNTIPSNDICPTALALRIPLLHSIPSSTIYATTKRIDACGNATAGEAPGVWYTIIGNSSYLKVTTTTAKSAINISCSIHDDDNNNSGNTNNRSSYGINDKISTASVLWESSLFQTQISIFIGNCDYGGGLVCVDGSSISSSIISTGRNNSNHRQENHNNNSDSDNGNRMHEISCHETHGEGGYQNLMSITTTTALTWYAEKNTLYYIYVHGHPEGKHEGGIFDLKVHDIGNNFSHIDETGSNNNSDSSSTNNGDEYNDYDGEHHEIDDTMNESTFSTHQGNNNTNPGTAVVASGDSGGNNNSSSGGENINANISSSISTQRRRRWWVEAIMMVAMLQNGL